MKKLTLAAAIIWAAASFPAFAQQGRQPVFVRAKAEKTVACQDEEKLRAVRDVLTWDVARPAGWERNLTRMGCTLVATDLRWRVVRRLDDLVVLQLAEEKAPPTWAGMMVVFVASDLVRMDGAPYR